MPDAPRLVDLAPQFLMWRRDPDGSVFLPYVNDVHLAMGVRFLCPKCFAANRGPVGTHGVLCWSRSRGVPDDARPGPGRWKMFGTGYADLTLTGDGGSNSILLTAGCMWHGYVNGGTVTNA